MKAILTANRAVKVLELRAHGYVRQKLEIKKSVYCINGKATEILKCFNNCDIQMLPAWKPAVFWVK